MAEEGAAFDPSGSSGLQDDGSSHSSSGRASSWHGGVTSEGTEDTELTGMTQTLGALDFQGPGVADGQRSSRGRDVAGLEDLSPAEKSGVLKEMFPTAKGFDIDYTLKKVGNNFGKAVEELLNHAFLEEEGLKEEDYHIKRGIDAFTEPAINGRGRRGRRKKRQLLRRTSSTPASKTDGSLEIPEPLSRWDRAKEDVDFITQRTYVSPLIVSSVYHKNSASLPATIAALCDLTDSNVNPNPYLGMASPSILEAHAAELSVDFQRLPYLQLAALIKLTHPSTASAHELARALVSQPASTSTAKIIPQYLPRPPSPSSTSSPSSSSSIPLPSPSAAALATTRSNAFTQAQSAYRKSKSKPLMGGAAAYYSSVGRDASASLRRHEAAAAYELVANKSRPGEVDLHGTIVKDAVNIARASVESWWEREGREWARQGKAMGGGLRVITGAGRHSEGGRGRLGPAVGGMLVREGWKVEVGEGVINVVGRARK